MRAVAAVVVVALVLPTAAAERRGGPLLWRVERDGKTSHLFGTVHLPLDLDAALGTKAVPLADAKRVFLELDHGTGIEFIRQAIARAELPPNLSLRSLLRPAAWTRLTQITSGVIDAGMLDRLEPWFVALTVVHLGAPRRRIAALRRDVPPLDARIDARARNLHIPLESLESTFDHLQVMSRMARSEGVALVEEALADPEKSHDELAGLVNAYVAEGDRPLLKTFGRLVRRKPALAERLLYRRNEAWRDRLELWLRDGRMFVAAGTFHMFGERGLVALLRQRGYRVERVRSAAEPRKTARLIAARPGRTVVQ
jgi:uncharacterized protein YbaP (TraB family)